MYIYGADVLLFAAFVSPIVTKTDVFGCVQKACVLVVRDISTSCFLLCLCIFYMLHFGIVNDAVMIK